DCTILKNKGPLTSEERSEVEKHPVIGASIISFLKGFDEAARMVRYHHEYFDGTGYPEGLKGDKIPIVSRIVHLLDVYDSLTSTRPYRPAMAEGDIYRILDEGRGTMFDPLVLDIFMEVIKKAS
ncbi:MAG: HD domain-containing phosphohydrolase, partial [Nitrospirota bacterium]